MTERKRTAGCMSVRSRVEAELWGSLSLMPIHSRTGIKVTEQGGGPVCAGRGARRLRRSHRRMLRKRGLRGGRSSSRG